MSAIDRALNPWAYRDSGGVEQPIDRPVPPIRVNGAPVVVPVQALDRAAGNSDQVHAGQLKAAAQPDSCTPAAASGLTGWQTGAALTRLTERWDGFQQTLSGQLGSSAENLRTTARDYAATEQANTAAFQGR